MVQAHGAGTLLLYLPVLATPVVRRGLLASGMLWLLLLLLLARDEAFVENAGICADTNLDRRRKSEAPPSRLPALKNESSHLDVIPPASLLHRCHALFVSCLPLHVSQRLVFWQRYAKTPTVTLASDADAHTAGDHRAESPAGEVGEPGSASSGSCGAPDEDGSSTKEGWTASCRAGEDEHKPSWLFSMEMNAQVRYAPMDCGRALRTSLSPRTDGGAGRVSVAHFSGACGLL